MASFGRLRRQEMGCQRVLAVRATKHGQAVTCGRVSFPPQERGPADCARACSVYHQQKKCRNVRHRAQRAPAQAPGPSRPSS